MPQAHLSITLLQQFLLGIQCIASAQCPKVKMLDLSATSFPMLCTKPGLGPRLEGEVQALQHVARGVCVAGFEVLNLGSIFKRKYVSLPSRPWRAKQRGSKAAKQAAQNSGDRAALIRAPSKSQPLCTPITIWPQVTELMQRDILYQSPSTYQKLAQRRPLAY